jgi:glycerol-3-phosphate dehydrogenase
MPWLGRLLVGTTDQEVTLDDDMNVTRDEVEYLLQHLNRYSTLQYSVEDVVSAFSGVRPLLRAKHARQTKKLIREHEVEVDQATGLISILGGKWTTYRAMAEDTVDVVQKQLGLNRPSITRHHRLAGAAGYHPDDWRLLASDHRLDEVTARHLLEKFGDEAPAVLATAATNPELKSPIVVGAPAIQAEIVYCARQEMAITIEDVLARRIGLQTFSWSLAMQAAPVVAGHLARELGWSQEEKDGAVRDYVDKVARMLQMVGLRAS